MTDPIDHLLAEHRDIMAEVAGLRRAVADLRAHGDAALPAARPALDRVARMMATRLLRHARKEDDALFPAVEKAFGDAEGPTAVMRQEHRDIHAHAAHFRETLRELHEVEHPAIEAGGERLRALATLGADAAALVATAEEVVALLDLHFAKEEDVLFPMARSVLSREELAEVDRKMDAIETEGSP